MPLFNIDSLGLCQFPFQKEVTIANIYRFYVLPNISLLLHKYASLPILYIKETYIFADSLTIFITEYMCFSHFLSPTSQIGKNV